MPTINEFSKEEVEITVRMFLSGTPPKTIAKRLHDPKLLGDCSEGDILMILRHEMNRMKEELGE